MAATARATKHNFPFLQQSKLQGYATQHIILFNVLSLALIKGVAISHLHILYAHLCFSVYLTSSERHSGETSIINMQMVF